VSAGRRSRTRRPSIIPVVPGHPLAPFGSPRARVGAPAHNVFTGRVKWVRIDLDADSNDHLIDPEHLLNLAMTKQ
jgi:hypothetical protein